jgi:hypothetical protein
MGAAFATGAATFGGSGAFGAGSGAASALSGAAGAAAGRTWTGGAAGAGAATTGARAIGLGAGAVGGAMGSERTFTSGGAEWPAGRPAEPGRLAAAFGRLVANAPGGVASTPGGALGWRESGEPVPVSPRRVAMRSATQFLESVASERARSIRLMDTWSRATTPPANETAAKASTQCARVRRRGKTASLGNGALTGRIVDCMTASGMGRDDGLRGVALGIGAGREDAGREGTLRRAAPGGGTGTRCAGNGGDHEGGRVAREGEPPTARTGGNCACSSLTPLATLISIARSLLDSTLAIAGPLLRGPRPRAVSLYTSVNPLALGNWNEGASGTISGAGYGSLGQGCGHVMGKDT